MESFLDENFVSSMVHGSQSVPTMTRSPRVKEADGEKQEPVRMRSKRISFEMKWKL
jgi:hypothetical protein